MAVFTVSVPGASLWCESIGFASGEPVLVLHGGPGADSRYLRPQCDALVSVLTSITSINLVYFDQRGAERSPLNPGVLPAGYAEHVADVEAVRKTLASDQVSLVGYSWGGLLALLYALRYPQRVRRLVLLAPAPAWHSGRLAMQHNFQQAQQRTEVLALREQWLTSENTLNEETHRRRRFALAVAGYFYRAERALEMTPFRVNQRASDAVWQSLGDYDVRSQLSSLHALPSVVIQGRQDVIPVESAIATATALRSSLVLLEECGHAPFVETPEPLWSAVRTFWQNSL